MFDLAMHGQNVLKKSRFGHFYHRDGITCAYHAYKIITLYFGTELFRSLTNVLDVPPVQALTAVSGALRPEFERVLGEICDAGIFVPQDYDETKYLLQTRGAAFTGPAVRVLVLHLTDFCNLDCGYCFIEGNIPACYQRQDMPFTVMEQALLKFNSITSSRTLPKTPSVVFYGGEPLTNWKTLKHGLRFMARAQREGRIRSDLDKVLITNGTLVTQDIAAELAAHNVMVSLSLDGPREINDVNRKFRGGQGSFDAAVRGFHLLRQAGVRPTVSCVLSKDSLPHAPQIIRWLLGELGVRALGFNHVSIVPRVNEYDPEYEAGFGRALLQVQEIIQQEFPGIYERRMSHKIRTFTNREILRADCTGCGEQMSVSPDGKIGICQGYMGSRKTFGACVFDESFDPSTDPVFVEWANRSPLNMPECFDCPALSTCGGGCPRNADVLHGSIWQVDSAFCHFAKAAQEWLIWKQYENTTKK